MNADALNALIFWFPAFLFSTTFHEAAHAFVALRGGDSTAYHGGQVSLSPLPHMRREPIGMVVVPIITSVVYGWAMGWASAPYDRAWAQRFPRRAAVMAAAGPAANLALAAIAFTLLELGLMTGIFVTPEFASMDLVVKAADGGGTMQLGAFAAHALSVMLSLNVLLGCFNLLPVPPLDGVSVVTLLMPENAARRFQDLVVQPMFSLLGLFAAWKVFPFLARPVFRFVLHLMHPDAF